MTSLSDFQAFLTCSSLINHFDRSSRVFGHIPVRISWTAWMDPGVHTGFAMVTYAQAEIAGGLEAVGVAEHYHQSMLKIGVCGWRREPGAVVGGIPDLCSAALLAIHTELLTGEETQQVRTAIGRVRKMSDKVGDPGPAGIGAETFINLRSERDRDYLSPVRIRSMFAYALEDEFGVEMDGQQPGDAKNAFSDLRMKRAGLYIPGPDHVRDALAHALLAIRRNG